MAPHVTHVEVGREGDALVVTWQGSGRAVVTAGPDPDEAGPVTVEPDEPHRVVLAGLDPRVRHYVRVQVGDEAVVAAERLVPLEGTLNLRDLGGYRGAGGRRVRWGRVFRSDGLHELTDADGTYLAGMGVRLVCDLRNEHEVGQAPSRLPGDLTVEAHPMGGTGEERQILDRLLDGEIPAFGVPEMVASYAELLESGAAGFAAVVRRAADPDRHAVLFHCTAGKDRTGLASALILRVLGVAPGDVCDDYALTTEYRSAHRLPVLRPRLEEAGVDVDAVLPFLTAQRPVMEATLAHLDERYGGAEGYLVERADVPAATLDDLRASLLVDP